MLIQDTVANQSTESKAIPTSEIPDDLMLRRISVAEYHEMIRAGILQSGDPVELLEGWLVEKMSKSPVHRIATQRVRRSLRNIISSLYLVDSQEPITLAESEPEPDIAILFGNEETFDSRHPNADEVRIVIEVADSSLGRDRGSKKRIYARAGIPVYWIVNLTDHWVEVYENPISNADEPDYRSHQTYGIDEQLPVRIDGANIGSILVHDLLPN